MGKVAGARTPIDGGLIDGGPIGPRLVRLAVPIMAANLLQSAAATINTIWIGRLLGAQALAASANVSSLLFFLLSLAFGLGMAASILVGQAIGAGQVARVKAVVGTAMTAFVAAGVVGAAVGLGLDHAVLTAMRTPGQVMDLALAYLGPTLLALPAITGLTALMMLLRGAGDVRTPLGCMAVLATLDAGLNPLLIHGVGPVHALGIAGSAWATLVANVLTLLALVAWLYIRRSPLRLVGAELRLLWPKAALVRLLFAKGLPIGLQVVVMSASMIVLVSFVDRYGSTMVAAYGACLQLWNYVQMPAFAVGMAVSAMAAQAIGAGRMALVERITLWGIAINIGLTSSLVALITLGDRPVLGLFLGSDRAAIGVAAHIQASVSWSFVIFSVALVLGSAIRAAGVVMVPLLVMVVAIWVIRLPAAWWGMGRFGIDAVLWSFPLGSSASVLLSGAYYLRGGWRRAELLIGAATAPPEE